MARTCTQVGAIVMCAACCVAAEAVAAAEAATTEGGAPLSPADETEALGQHNVYRCMHGLEPLTWSSTLAAAAQQWADRGTFEHSDADGAGENLALGQASFHDSVVAWYGEIERTCPFGVTDMFSFFTGHYTQVVWPSTREVGCGKGVSKSDQRPLYVCKYAPAGNVKCAATKKLLEPISAPVKTAEECGGKTADAPSKPKRSCPNNQPPQQCSRYVLFLDSPATKETMLAKKLNDCFEEACSLFYSAESCAKQLEDMKQNVGKWAVCKYKEKGDVLCKAQCTQGCGSTQQVLAAACASEDPAIRPLDSVCESLKLQGAEGAEPLKNQPAAQAALEQVTPSVALEKVPGSAGLTAASSGGDQDQQPGSARSSVRRFDAISDPQLARRRLVRTSASVGHSAGVLAAAASPGNAF